MVAILSPVSRCPIVTQHKHPIEDVPDTPIRGLGLSFREIAVELDRFVDELMSFPQTVEFLANPYNLNGSNVTRVEVIDRLWTRVANRFVNDHGAFPSPQWHRRITFVTNSGRIFINSQTFRLGASTNYSCLFTSGIVNPISDGLLENPSNNLAIPPASSFYNPENTDYSQMYTSNGSQLAEFENILMGSTTPPNTDPHDLTHT